MDAAQALAYQHAAVVLGLQTVGHLSAPRGGAVYLRSFSTLFNSRVPPKPLNDAKDMTMKTAAIDALHDIHTATNDVLKGYREMTARAEPDIQTVIRRLTEMHERHALAQQAELARLRDATQDDSSLQGTVNKVVVILRDWLSNLDREALPAVRMGEESLLDEYKKALKDLQVIDNPSIVALLQTQSDSIASEIARLPKS